MTGIEFTEKGMTINGQQISLETITNEVNKMRKEKGVVKKLNNSIKCKVFKNLNNSSSQESMMNEWLQKNNIKIIDIQQIETSHEHLGMSSNWNKHQTSTIIFYEEVGE